MTTAVPTGWSPRGRGHRGLDASPELPSLDERLDAREQKMGAATGDVDNRHLLVTLDQGQSESCLFHAGAMLLRGVHIHQGIANPDLASIKLMWDQGREYENTFPQNVGCYPSTLYLLWKTVGFGRAKDCPWNPTDFTKRDALSLDRMEFDQRVLDTVDWCSLESRADLDRVLHAGLLAGWGGNVSNAFCRGDFDPTKPVDAMITDIAGGHEMVICGKVGANYWMWTSWGADFAQGGFLLATPTMIDSGLNREGLLGAPYFAEVA